MSYTGYILLILSANIILIGAWRFLKHQDACYERDLQKKQSAEIEEKIEPKEPQNHQ